MPAVGGETAQGGASAGGTNAVGGSTSVAVGGSSAGTGTGGQALACKGIPVAPPAPTASTGEACLAVETEAQTVPFPTDLYLMVDRSSSMLYTVPNSRAVTRWSALQAGLQQYLIDASSEDVRLGIGFFGASEFGGDDVVDCNIENYSTPKVEIATPAENGDALVAAMAENPPAGLTPTLPALVGALSHARNWIASGESAGRSVAVVLLTDGYPTQCQSPVSIQKIADVAKAAYVEAGVRTFVIGLAAGFNLDTIALAGGTNGAKLIDENQPTSSFAAALLSTTSFNGCEYRLPPPPSGTEIAPNEVMLLFTSPTGAEQEIPRADTPLGEPNCALSPQGGWYYDNPANPKSILVCPCTCSLFAGGGRIHLAVGCSPTFGPR